MTEKIPGILLGGAIVFSIFVWERALPSTNSYKRLTHSINGELSTLGSRSQHYHSENTTRWAQIVFNVMPERADEDISAAIGGGKSKVCPDTPPPEGAWNDDDEEKSSLSTRL